MRVLTFVFWTLLRWTYNSKYCGHTFVTLHTLEAIDCWYYYCGPLPHFVQYPITYTFMLILSTEWGVSPLPSFVNCKA
jgi:hypothetical protein